MMHVVRSDFVTARTPDRDLRRCVVVPIDVGKHAALAGVEDFTGARLCRPIKFKLTRDGIAGLVAAVIAVLPDRVEVVRAGVEACGHYHRPVVAAGVLPADWEVVELNPAWVTAQRRANGTARRKTDAIDVEAIADLLRAGKGYPVPRPGEPLVALQAWVVHRRRRVLVRSGLKNQLTGQLDRAFPGLGSCLSSVLATKVGRLVAAEFADPARLSALGAARFRRFAANRNVQVSDMMADRLVAAAKTAIPTADAAVTRQVITADLALLADLDAQVADATAHIAGLIPATPYAVLRTGPGWADARVGSYAAAVGDLLRWPTHRQIYRAAGLTPMQYESAGTRRDGKISREGSVTLRQAILDLGIGLWHQDPAARRYAQTMRDRGKPGGIIGCALGRRANKIAFAMVRDQTAYDPIAWPTTEVRS